MTNHNPETGIAYGYISARCLNDDLVCELQDKGADVCYELAWEEYIAEMRQIFEDEEETRCGECERAGCDFVAGEFCEEDYRDEFNNAYQCDEPIHEGEMDGVKYRTSWLGGALNVWIFKSPHVTHHARQCSLCVPGAGDLDNLDGNHTCYDVPPDWRQES